MRCSICAMRGSCHEQARSLPELSQSPCFERAWPSLYQALSHGRINEDLLREVWVKALLSEIPETETIWISVDSSTIPRPEAETSQDRGIIHVSNLPRAAKPISVGWPFSTVMLLPQEASRWVGLLDQERISTEQTAIGVAIAQLRAVVPLAQRRIIIVADRWYATAEFLRACQALGCQVLIRLKRNRKLYRLPVRTSRKGRMPLDGPLLQGTRPETVTGAKAIWMSHDEQGQRVSVSRWSGLHFRQAREVPVRFFCVQRDGAKDNKRDPRESWFVCLDEHPISIPLAQVMRSYGRRFSHEHGYRYLKQDLFWTEAHVRTPEQFERWSVCVGIVMNQLRLARDLGQACYRPWEARRQTVTPRQVRRIMPAILSQVGTPTRRCQRRGKSPGRAVGYAS